MNPNIRKNSFFKKVLILFASFMLLNSAMARHPQSNLVETAIEAGQFTILVAALEATGLDQALADEHANFTVFAPTDAAFAELGDDTIAALLQDPEALSNILLYHVLGQANSALSLKIRNGQSIETLNGQSVDISLHGFDLFINQSEVIVENVFASNGVIQVIDKVLIPSEESPQTLNIVETAVNAGGFETLVTALQATGLDQALADENSRFTVFAPTDAAFDALGADTIAALLANPEALSDILLYHVASGTRNSDQLSFLSGFSQATLNGDRLTVNVTDEGLYLNQSLVVVKDIEATNGIIHVIDRVLIPVSDQVSPGTIVDVAVANGNFTILVAALQAAGLDGILATQFFNFTVFAPTDAAFEALGQDTINALLADPSSLRRILLYHTSFGNKASVDLLRQTRFGVGTLIGQRVDVSIEGGDILLDDSKVVIQDIQTENGIIHVIDAVLIPDSH